MAALRRLLVDKQNRKLVSAINSTAPAYVAPFVNGDKEDLQIVFLDKNPLEDRERPYVAVPILNTLAVSLGVPALVPTDGLWTVTDPAGGQTSSLIPFSSNQAAIQAAIRASLTTNYGNCTVQEVEPGWYILDRVTTGAIAPLTGDGSALIPAGVVSVGVQRVGATGVSARFILRLRQRSAGYLDSGWTDIPAATVSVVSKQTGSATAPIKNAIFRVSISDTSYDGAFTLNATTLGVANTTTATSGLIPYSAEEAEFEAAILAGWGAGNEVTVSRVGQFVWDVEMTGNNIKAKAHTLLTANSDLLVGLVGRMGRFSLANTNSDQLLVNDAQRSVRLEIENSEVDEDISTVLFIDTLLVDQLIAPELLGATENPSYVTTSDLRGLALNSLNGDIDGLTGGTAGKVDALSLATWSVNDAIFFILSGVPYGYVLVTDASAESSPDIIKPDSDSSKSWIRFL